MLTRKSIDTVLLSVGAEKLSQREWDWMKMLKPMDPPPAMVTTSILKRRGDTAALTLLQDTGGLIHPHVVGFTPRPLKRLFTANQCWTSFTDAGGLRDIEVEAVTKMLACGTRILGVKEFGV